MRVHLKFSRDFGGHFGILGENGCQNINFGGKIESLEIEFGLEWNLRKLGGEIGFFYKKKWTT